MRVLQSTLHCSPTEQEAPGCTVGAWLQLGLALPEHRVQLRNSGRAVPGPVGAAALYQTYRSTPSNVALSKEDESRAGRQLCPA